jgi:hypothetical protein
MVPDADRLALPSGTGALRFAHAARALAIEARRHGLVVPGFRTPPRLAGVDRSLRRRNGGVSVAVRVRGRAWEAVVADLIAGIVVVNGLVGPEADRVRAALWAAAGFPSAGDVARPGTRAA